MSGMKGNKVEEIGQGNGWKGRTKEKRKEAKRQRGKE